MSLHQCRNSYALCILYDSYIFFHFHYNSAQFVCTRGRRKRRSRPVRCSGSFAPSPSSRHVRLAWQRGKCIGNTGGCFKRLARAGIWCVFGSTIIVFTPNMTAQVQVSRALHCTCTPAAPEGQGRCEHDTCTAAQRCPTIRIAADTGGGQCPRVVRQAGSSC